MVYSYAANGPITDFLVDHVGGYAFYVYGGSIITANGLVHDAPDGMSYSSGSTFDTSAGMVGGDPLLDADYSPMSGSPAIDAGVGAADRDGSASDLGAYGGPEGY